ncbi:hypothetical protein B0H13DRAFT_2082523 [Mycena leptocephala]|nr:hypothetical protein B0H13DRAFT_2082523 [Mycena leptocephala]
MNNKRHSMPVGPRPLQLANGPVSDGLPSASLSSFSPSPLTPSTPTTPNGGPRRQSSITYNPSTRPARTAGHRSTLVRSNSVGGSLDRRSTVPERSPVTLAEKHADLLHFIAQKESKCLELRSQLAMHEAELLQLKRKWERIVSRGFTSPHNTSLASTSTSSGTSSGGTSLLENSPNPTSANGGAMLDGIHKGVQGVGRFIAAFSPTTPYSPSAASYFESAKRGGTHSTSSSTSTMGTSTTKSMRLSQSSLASSLASSVEEPVTPDEEDPDAQVLMVHDTGATPTMSPNPAFNARRQQLQRDHERRTGASGGDSSAEAEEDFFFASAQASAAMAMSTPPPTARPATMETSTPSARPTAGKRASGGGIPGLTLVDSVAPVSAWVGSVGKKWEELQRVPTFAKNSKRASLLFSDIAYALQVGPVPSQSPSPTPTPALTSSSLTSPSPAMSSSSSLSLSLLDDDADLPPMMPDAPALKPAPASSLRLTPRPQTRQQQPQSQSPLSLSKSKVPPKAKPPQQAQKQTLDDDEEEWNW